MIEQPAFGQRVKEMRRSFHLSQEDVAGEGISPSYVSLVETGRRIPSVRAAKVMAEQLGVTLEDLCTPEPEEHARSNRIELVGQLVSARSAHLSGDLQLARSQLERFLENTGAGTEELRWEAMWELATVLGELSEVHGQEKRLRSLLDDQLTESAPVLRAGVSTELAALLMNTGRLTEAVMLAENAVRDTEGLNSIRAEHVQARVALLAIYTNTGDWHRNHDLAESLHRQADALPDGSLKATLLWAVGGSRYLDGRPDDALDLLSRAAELLGERDDNRIRNRLAIARILLAYATGHATEARKLLAHAQGYQGDITDIAHTSWLRVLGSVLDTPVSEGDAAAVPDPGVDWSVLTPLDRARCTMLLARARRASGQEETAMSDFRSAAARYEESGAFRLAMAAWRECEDQRSGGGDATATTPDAHSLLMR